MLLTDDVDLVKDQIRYHRRAQGRYSSDPVRRDRHKSLADKFENLVERLAQTMDEVNNRVNGDAVAIPKPGQLRIGNLDDLPPELRQQLNITQSDELELDIQEAIKSFGGAASIDEILVGLWRKTKVVQERDFISRKLYRMTKRETVFSVPKRKGLYSVVPVEPPADDDAPEDEEILDE